MGSTSSHVLQQDCQAGRYKTVVSHSDPLLGQFNLIRFAASPGSLFLLEQFSPKSLDKYGSDLQEFIRLLLKKHKNVCEFAFVSPRLQGDMYDVVCEYGDAVFPNFHSEKLLWGFLSNILNGLLFLHSIGLHYPSVHKRYTVFFASLNCFKLVNPFCFPEFVTQVVGVFKNPGVSVSAKAKLFNESLSRNLREVGSMILAILFGVEDFPLVGVELKSLASDLRGKVTDPLIEFIVFALEPRMSPVPMAELANFFTGCFSRAKTSNCGSVPLPLARAKPSASPARNQRVEGSPSPAPVRQDSTSPAPSTGKPPFREIQPNVGERGLTRMNTPCPGGLETSHHKSATTEPRKENSSTRNLIASTTSIASTAKPPVPGQRFRMVLMSFGTRPDFVLYSVPSKISSKFEAQRKMVNDLRVQRPTMYHLVEEEGYVVTRNNVSVSPPPRVPTARNLFETPFA